MNHDCDQHCDQHMKLRLPRHPRSVGRGREALREIMGLSGELGETAALLLSELVTNALRHGSPPGREIVVTAWRADGLLRMEVEDAGETLPQPRTPDPGPDLASDSDPDECGRGLALVTALAENWGVEPRKGPGKRVWVTLKAPDH
ncbi:ATP-binding protein [Streptomyces sp. NBC_01506]|uniref:ATP-binding protein n=1 Tax=Streptomyces sp. NBC_01506 TaxID=2903887 RepID=UPI00386A9A75